ncbi:hypothetical protein BC938DRAFT_476776 [Jimgerdemannia flammicorona]|uniref:Uncharacterized protein n=1 Tax=Jimgerdemannia flammicorona TaxID=994334 RepID=A0A433QQ85_9FUNG|nr:hypothetical protein BC938DRAFT_476776 [Jimgerdemannia flammicorona]
MANPSYSLVLLLERKPGLRKSGLDRSRATPNFNVDPDTLNFSVITTALTMTSAAFTTKESKKTAANAANPFVRTFSLRPDDIRHLASHLIANVKLANVATKLTVPHSTGAWHILLAKTKDSYTIFQDGSKFYFELAKEKDVINDEFTFNHMLEVTEPNEKNKLILNLAVRIKGLGKWSINEVLHLLLFDQYSSLAALPELDIDTIGQSYTVNSEQKAIFKGNLKKIAEGFHQEVTTNEATSRNFINPFMVEAVATVQKEYSSTRGYGRLNYVIFCNDLAVVVTEAKKIEFQKGITQNIVQLHTAIERKRDDSSGPEEIYGIVTTGDRWSFLSWSNNEKPVVLISKPYQCNFSDEMAGVTKALSTISRILMSQAAKAVQIPSQTGSADSNEGASQRVRTTRGPQS